MIYSQAAAAAAHLYLAASITISILVTSIFGVALSIILNLRSDQHVETHNLHRRRAWRNDPGAVSGKYIEKALTLKTALACQNYLRNYECETVMARTTDKSCTVAYKMEEVEKKRPSLVLEIHYNAGGGEGCEVYYWHTHAPSKSLAQKVLAEMVKLGQKEPGDQGEQGGHKLQLRHVPPGGHNGIPSILGEYAFVDNAKDQAKINSDAKLRAVGEAYAKAAVSYLGLRKRSTAGDAPSTKPEAIGVGDIVQFAGGKVYASSTATAAASTRREQMQSNGNRTGRKASLPLYQRGRQGRVWLGRCGGSWCTHSGQARGGWLHSHDQQGSGIRRLDLRAGQ